MELFDLHCDTLVTYQQMKADFLCDATMFSLRNQEKLTRMCQTMAIFVPDEVRGKAAEEYFDQNSAYLKSLIKKQPHLAAHFPSPVIRSTSSPERACAARWGCFFSRLFR